LFKVNKRIRQSFITHLMLFLKLTEMYIGENIQGNHRALRYK